MPFVDEHRISIAAPAGVVWEVLCAKLPGFADAGWYGRLLSLRPGSARGTLPGEGSAIPGFEVSQAIVGERLRLSGGHRFSTYSLTFTLESREGVTILGAVTDADFPGVLGRGYRLAVIGSGAHRFLVRRLLRAVRDRSAALAADGRTGPGEDPTRESA